MAIASDIIIIGGSAGSYTLIAGLLEQLPFNFEAAICIVLHRNRHYDTKIEKSLSRKLNKNINVEVLAQAPAHTKHPRK